MILSIVGLDIGYGRKIVQRSLNLQAGSGRLICLVGRNGYGKSTLLRTIAGLQPPLAGEILIDGQDVTKMSDGKRSLLMSLVLTDRIDVDNMTVSDLVALGRYPYTSWNGSLSPEDKEIVADAMRRVNIFHQKDKPINCISDGEKQRAVIAKALAQDTPLVLLDEPTSHLDLSSRIDIMFLLRDLSHTTKKTFVLSTHELDLAIGMADYIWLMQQNGVTTGIPEDLLLDGTFRQSLANDNFDFDTDDGHYRIIRPQGTLNAAIVGNIDSDRARWLRCAFRRCGVAENHDSANSVEIDGSRFVFGGRTSERIEDVVDWVCQANSNFIR